MAIRQYESPASTACSLGGTGGVSGDPPGTLSTQPGSISAGVVNRWPSGIVAPRLASTIWPATVPTSSPGPASRLAIDHTESPRCTM